MPLNEQGTEATETWTAYSRATGDAVTVDNRTFNDVEYSRDPLAGEAATEKPRRRAKAETA